MAYEFKGKGGVITYSYPEDKKPDTKVSALNNDNSLFIMGSHLVLKKLPKQKPSNTVFVISKITPAPVVKTTTNIIGVREEF